ncbi:MAG TPA: metallophosphatase [Bacteroidetes bacterium]|nr:metallophosphatase [Bacteroidota bacterium]
MSNRRKFLQQMGTGALLLGANSFPLDAFANYDSEKLTILHTNDWHSRIDPFPMDGGKYQGLGGVATRASLIQKLRAAADNVLLLDAGDIFQGTPYFNYYHGELEMKLMSQMQYDASAIGNHDFDNGVGGLAAALPHATFPLICSNYDFTNTAMQGKTITYKIFKKGKIKIGVFGLGIELKGLVPEKMFGETKYLEPISIANTIAAQLKHEEKCNIVICLSHLGYKYQDKKISDEIFAQSTSNIDLIIGGHTHTFFDAPVSYKNSEGKQVLVNQVGWAGLVLGKIDFYFKKNLIEKQATSSTVIVTTNPN